MKAVRHRKPLPARAAALLAFALVPMVAKGDAPSVAVLRHGEFEAERLTVIGDARIETREDASGQTAIRLETREARIEGKALLGKGVWRICIEGFGEDPSTDSAYLAIGNLEFRFFYEDGSQNWILDILVDKAGELPFSIRTEEPGVLIDRVTIQASPFDEETIRRSVDEIRRTRRNKARRFFSLDAPFGTQLGILGEPLMGDPPAPRPRPAEPETPPAPAPIASADDALRAAGEKGEVLWSQSDSGDANLLWISIKGKFLTLHRRAEGVSDDFSMFVELAIGDAVTARGIAFSKAAVYVATDRGLLRWDRAGRSWDVVAVGRDARLGAGIASVELAADGVLSVKTDDGRTSRLKPDGAWEE